MTIFQPVCAEGYEWVNPCDSTDYRIFSEFDGRPRSDSWKPIKVRRVRPDDKLGFNPSDFPWLVSDALVMRRTALDALRDILEVHGEVLPLATDDGVDLFVHNTRTVDALDRERSSMEYFPDATNQIMSIHKLVFLESAIRDLDMFRLSQQGLPTYVSERFVERVKSAGLRGLDFLIARCFPIWPWSKV